MKFFNGLYSYEVILLFSGVIVLLVLLVAFLRRIWTNQSFGALLPFFTIPIIMIAYPSIKSFSFQNGVVTINKNTDALRQDPSNTTLRDSLRNDIAKSSSRPTTDAGTLAIFGRAQLALGDEEAAQQSLAKAQQIDPNQPAVQQLNQRIQLGDQLRTLTSKAASAQGDASVRTELQSTVKQLESGGVADPKTLNEIASAHLVLGNSHEAVSVAKRALQIDPTLRTAQEIVKKSTFNSEAMQTNAK